MAKVIAFLMKHHINMATLGLVALALFKLATGDVPGALNAGLAAIGIKGVKAVADRAGAK